MDITNNSNLSFDEKKSLDVMKAAIATSKRAMMSDGLLLILWGTGLSISNFYNYYKTNYLLASRLQNFLDILQILIGVSILAITAYIIFRKKKVTTFASFTTRFVWIGVIIAHNIVIIITKAILTDINFVLLQPLQLVLIGFALFVSGGVYRYYLLVFSGVLMWAAAAFAANFDLTQQYLIRSVAEIICFIIPGILMYNARKKIS
jgi:hypothetical protein